MTIENNKTTNINIHGGHIAGFQAGDNNTQHNTQHFGQREATVETVFEAINEAMVELPEVDREEFETQVVEPLRLMANLPVAQQQEPSMMEKAQSLIERISPFASTINKAVMAFGEGSLSALASSNPIISGLLSAVKAVRTA